MSLKKSLLAAVVLGLPIAGLGAAPLSSAFAATPATSSGTTINPLKYACTVNSPTCNSVGTTHDFYNGTNVEALYTQKYFCDKSVSAHSQNGCEAGANYNQLPPGVASAAATDPLYIPVPLGFTPTQALQCSTSSTCIDHPMHIDLSRIAAALPGKPSPAAVQNAILPGHDHIITTTNGNQPEWWPVVVVGVTNQAAWTTIVTAKSYAAVQTLQANSNSGVTGNIPTNVFLYFQTLPGQVPQARANITSTAVPPSSITSRGTTYTNLKDSCTTNPGPNCENIGLTHDWINGQNVDALYTENFFCDKSVSSQAPSGCEAGATYKQLPPGVSSASFTDPLYIPVPLYKGASGYLQCPAGQVCIDHPSSIDLSRLSSALGVPASSLANTMLPGHDHILTTRNANQPEWWPVVVIGVTSPSAFAKIESAKSLAEVRSLQGQSGSGVTGDIPTNVFLNFQTLPGSGSVTPPGYDVASSHGNVYNYGGMGWYGSPSASGIHSAPIVGFQRTADGRGYYLLSSKGNIYTFGDAHFFGSPAASGIGLNDATGFRMTANGGGYYVVTAKGQVFNYGDAGWAGSPSASHLTGSPITAIEVTASGGYYLLSSAGNVYNYRATWFGSMAGSHIGSAFVSIKTTPDGQGYWLVTGQGNVLNYGDAGWFGSPAASGAGLSQVVDIHVSSDGKGYDVVSGSGRIFNYGDSGWFGSPSASGVAAANVVGAS